MNIVLAFGSRGKKSNEFGASMSGSENLLSNKNYKPEGVANTFNPSICISMSSRPHLST